MKTEGPAAHVGSNIVRHIREHLEEALATIAPAEWIAGSAPVTQLALIGFPVRSFVS